MITPRSRSTLVPIIPLSRFSRAREFPYPHLALGKPVEEAALVAFIENFASNKVEA